jgi:hypothetical protein
MVRWVLERYKLEYGDGSLFRGDRSFSIEFEAISRRHDTSELQSDIVEEVPARVNHSNAQPKMTEYVGSLGFA